MTQNCRFCDVTGRFCQTESSRGDGIQDADFVFYVSSTQTDRCNKGATVAYAAHCQQESGMDRPVAGHANLCPDSISTKPQDLETLLSTVKHEILHALGFSVSLYAYFRDKDGKPLTQRNPRTGKPIQASRETAAVSGVPFLGENVIKRLIRHDWKVRSGSIKKEVHMIVTPRVVVSIISITKTLETVSVFFKLIVLSFLLRVTYFSHFLLF